MKRLWWLAIVAACGPRPVAHEKETQTSAPGGADDDTPTPVDQPEGTGAVEPDRPPTEEATLSPDANAILDASNADRAKHCAPPLAWSDTLAAVAQKWADHLRDAGCAFEHSSTEYGENLAGGSTGALPPEAVVAMWYDEKHDFDFKRGGFGMDTGHFTQLVWVGTTSVGCGMSQCNGMDIWVCNYDPPGNVDGEYRDNVLPTSCR